MPRSTLPSLVAHGGALALLLAVGGCGDALGGASDLAAAGDLGPADSALPDPADGAVDGGGAAPDLVTAAPVRLVALSLEGAIASLDATPPFAVRATADLGAPTGSARCHAGRCLVVHPAPADALTLVDARTLAVLRREALPPGSDPRDAALLDGDRAIVSLYGGAGLLSLDLGSGERRTIDLGPLADADGLPEAQRIAACGRRLFVQLARVDHDSQTPAPGGAVLAVVDVDQRGDGVLVDTDGGAAGVQGVRLAQRPGFDLVARCEEGSLYVSEPRPLFQGGSRIQRIDLATFTAGADPIEVTAQGGGFEVAGPGLFWLITHTDTGPGPSSHLTLEGGPPVPTHNTFARHHVDELALDRAGARLFYPDPCFTGPTNTGCQTGIHVFHATTGARLAPAVDLGFAPMEVALAW